MDILKAVSVALFVTGTFTSACVSRQFNKSQTSPKYVASASREVTLAFDSSVQFSAESTFSNQDVLDVIHYQIEHMFGPMGDGSGNTYKAVPKGDHEITKVDVQPFGGGRFEAKYHYKGTLALHKSAGDKIKVILPIDPTKIYAAGMRGSENPCTDHHYQSEGDFWYFWSPFRAGCQLKEGVDYKQFEAVATPVGNVKAVSYPEYKRMVDSDGAVHISLLVGLDDATKNWDPNASNDHMTSTFTNVRYRLLNAGFAQTKIWQNDDLEALLKTHNANAPKVESLRNSSTGQYPFVVELEKSYTSGPAKKVKVRMFFGGSGINEDSSAFHYFLKDSLERDAMMIYAGHSGLGGHLDLDSIARTEKFKFQFNKDKYQIYYFNSCTSYSYYNRQYFARKRTSADPAGTKNLDIFTNGLATYMNYIPASIFALLEAVDTWATTQKPTSYQYLAQVIDSNNLFGINGDEDNPLP